jgi:uncharacterized RDD family membrane protein YckC
MHCPRCQGDEIDSSGICMICGYRFEFATSASGPSAVDKETESHDSVIEMGYSNDPSESPAQAELPVWRRELSQRLQILKQRRESTEANGKAEGNKRIMLHEDRKNRPIGQSPTQAKESTEKMLLSKPSSTARLSSGEKPGRSSKPQKTQNAGQKRMETPSSEPIKARPLPKTNNPQEVWRLIDGVVSKQRPRSETPASAGNSSSSTPDLPVQNEGKLIFLSRTLSGLIDLIFIVLWIGIIIISSDAISGIIVMDFVSLISYSALFLLTYFVYSIFFLASSNQTIGMMITDLRVVGPNRRRPLIGQIIYRCCGYLVSLFSFGIGLLWGLLDRDSLCFHDRLSHTQVIRI